MSLPDVLNFTKKEMDAMVPCISKWAHHQTTQNNWRIFNICTLSFLKKEGYKIDDPLLKDHISGFNEDLHLILCPGWLYFHVGT